MANLTPNLGLFKYDELTDQDVQFSFQQALNDNWDILDEFSKNLPSGRNIGEIVSSTIPLIDAGLHLLDGSLIQGSGIYSEFVDYIAGLDLTANYFCTEQEWQTAVTTYGVCGKFVYDGVNNTVRLPKYNSKIYTGGGTAPAKGNGKTLGLTDGTKEGGLHTSAISGYPYFTAGTTAINTAVGTSNTVLDLNNNVTVGITTDGTKSGIIADLSNITTSLDGYYYIVIATSTKTDIQVDIDEIATDLNAKVDKSTLREVYPVIETYNNGNSWYIVYSNGFCIQGSLYYKGTTIAGDNAVAFLKEFVNTNYTFLAFPAHSAANITTYTFAEKYASRTTAQTVLYSPGALFGYQWVAYGYVSMGS